MIRVRLDLSYRGTDFSGWAIQPHLRTVQGTVEDALAKVLRISAVRLVVAGRTDAGVHARGQVAHFDLDPDAWQGVVGHAGRGGRPPRTPSQALVARLRGVLPSDVVAHNATVVPPGFDARFSALLRRYTYRVADGPRLWDPLTRDYVLWKRDELDVDAMHRAMAPLLGLRDFTTYCKPRPGATTIRDLQQMSWTRVEHGPERGIILGEVQADAFCHNMVRALVGASLSVGTGKRAEGWPLEILQARRRDVGLGVVQAHGLTLEGVVYPPDDELASRAEQIRARRQAEDAR